MSREWDSATIAIIGGSISSSISVDWRQKARAFQLVIIALSGGSFGPGFHTEYRVAKVVVSKRKTIPVDQGVL